MPLAFTDYVRERQRQWRDVALKAFLDTFHHRSVSLFYRCWAVGRPAVNARPAKLATAAAFGGIGRSKLPRGALRQAGRLAPVAKSPDGLEKIIHAELGVPAKVIEMTGRHLPVAKADRTRLGARRRSRAVTSLGGGAILGRGVLTPSSGFELRVGPISPELYPEACPARPRSSRRPTRGRLSQDVLAWLEEYVEPGMSYGVVLIASDASARAARLGRRGQLGSSAWAGRSRFHRDAFRLTRRRRQSETRS